MLFLSSPFLWVVFQGLICVSQPMPQATLNGGQASDPPSWFQIGKQIFHVSTQDRNWLAARDYCITLGADLAQPSDLNALATYMLDNGVKRNFYWLGGSDAVQEGAWRWLDGDAIIGGWYEGEPDDTTLTDTGRAADCLAMYPGFGAKSLLDQPCELAFGCICQYH